MIHTARPTPNIKNVTLDGLVTQDDIATLRTAFDGFRSADGPLGLVVDMTRIDDMTKDAVAADARFELSMLPRLHRFDRVALVSDKRMLHALVGWLNRFVPGTEARPAPFRPPSGRRRLLSCRRSPTKHPILTPVCGCCRAARI